MPESVAVEDPFLPHGVSLLTRMKPVEHSPETADTALQ